MRIRSLVIRNTGFLLGGHVIGVLVSIVLAAILSRYLGVETYGQFTYIFAFSYLFLSVGDLGTDIIVVREASRHPDEAGTLLRATVTLKFFIALFSMVLAWAVIFQLSFPPALRDALIIAMLILPLRALEAFKLFFTAALKEHLVSLIGILNRLAELGFLGIMVLWGLGLRAMAAGLVAVAVVNLLVIFYACSRWFRPAPLIDFRIWGRMIGMGLPLGITAVFTAVINRIDFVMIEVMASPQELGFYAASYKVADLLCVLPLFIMATVYPLMSRYAVDQPQELRNIFKKSTLFLTAAGIPMGILITCFSSQIMRGLFGETFLEGHAVLRVLIWSTVFICMAMTAGNLLISIGRTGVSLSIAFFGALGNVMLNLSFIPRWGALGAALATSLTYLYVLLAETGSSYWFVFRRAGSFVTLPGERYVIP